MLAREGSNPVAMARFRTLLVRLSTTVAHELCNMFTNYLTLNRQIHTPRDVVYGPYGDFAVGESGRVWESLVWGGFIDLRDGAKCEAVAVRNASCTRAWVITLDKIDEILARGKFKRRVNKLTSWSKSNTWRQISES